MAAGSKSLSKGWKEMLTANDCKNAVALINRANIQGSEVEEVAMLKQRLLQHARSLEEDEDAPENPGGTE